MDTKTNALDNTSIGDSADPGLADSHELLAYIHQAAALTGLSIAPEHLPGVVANLERMQTIAQLVTEFPLLDTVEAAPTFEP